MRSTDTQTHAVYPMFTAVIVSGKDIRIGDLLAHGGLVTSAAPNAGSYPSPEAVPIKVGTHFAAPGDGGLPVADKKPGQPNYIPQELQVKIYRNLNAEEAPAMTEPAKTCKRPECEEPGADRDLNPYGHDITTIACDAHWAEWISAQPAPAPVVYEADEEFVAMLNSPAAAPEPETAHSVLEGLADQMEAEADASSDPEPEPLTEADRAKITKSLKRLAKAWAPHIILSDECDVLWVLLPEKEPEELTG